MSDQKRFPTIEEFRATRKRQTYRELIQTGDEIAANFAGIDAADLLRTNPNINHQHVEKVLNGETLAYTFGNCDEPSSFINILDNGDYYLVLGNYERIASNEAELAELEAELYDWRLSESEPTIELTDDDDEPESPGPS